MTDDRSPRLVWTEDGSPRSGRFDDVYFSKDDGLAETRAVFLAGCGLPRAWAGRRRFAVAELGLGTGLNIAALLDLWRREGPAGGHLSIFSIEGFPLDREEAARALSAWPEITAASDALLSVWPAATPGFHRLDLPAFRATLDLVVGDVAWALDQWTGRADAWFLDGFSPATNPGMWSDAVFDRIAARSAPDARIATFTVAGAVRRALADRGFAVDKRPGHGRKRERLEARGQGAPAPEPTPRVAIVGAGIAGAALTRAFTALGVRPTVIEAEAPGAGGSGFPSALVTPRFDAGDDGIAALFAQALTRAGRLYATVPDAVAARGVFQLEQAPRDAGRFSKISAQSVWPAGAMTPVDAVAASVAVGEAVDAGGLDMRDALALHPAPVLDLWLDGADRLHTRVAHLESGPDGWLLSDADGGRIIEADAVVLAAGWGNAALLPEVSLSPVRGQADWVEGETGPPVAWGGYTAPTADGLLFGATHDRNDVSTEVRAADSVRNRAMLAARLPALAARLEAAPTAARAAVRATTPDRLPLAGAVPGRAGLFMLGGLGSRGFCAAPLLAEHVAAMILDAPSPLPAGLAARVDLVRFEPCRGVAQPKPSADA